MFQDIETVKDIFGQGIKNRKEKQKYTIKFYPRQSYFTAKETIRKLNNHLQQ